MNNKITYIISGLVLITILCVGISKGMSNLEESFQPKHDSIQQAIEQLAR